MRPLRASRTFIQPRDQIVRYRGSASAVDEELLLTLLRELVVVRPLLTWLPSGGVMRDQETALSWVKWYCGHQRHYFLDSHKNNYRHVLLLVTDPLVETLNIVSRLEPLQGQGSISFRASVCRTSDDDYVCFE